MNKQVERAVKEVVLIRKGKLPVKTARDFLQEQKGSRNNQCKECRYEFNKEYITTCPICGCET